MEAIALYGGEALCAELEGLSRLSASKLARLQTEFRRRLREGGLGRAEVKALAAITPAAAARIFARRKVLDAFFEQVDYSGRRLAKLNVPPAEAARALRDSGVPAGQIHLATLVALQDAYYQVREAETQAFYGLFRAEAESRDLDDLLRRMVETLTRALRAQAGRLMLAGGIEPAVLRRLARPRYIERRGRDLILDPALRGLHACYWSVPFKSAERVEAVVQFGFEKPYPWLPRELHLLDAAAERCLAAVERRRLMADLAAREAEVRRLATSLIDVEERERRRISRELHDEAGQSMMLLRLELEKLERAAPAGPGQAKLAEVRGIAERIIAEIRRTIAALSPAVLEQLGLGAALRHLAAWLERTAPAKVRVSVNTGRERLPAEIETVIYRLAQECCHNIARHARARRVNLSLDASDRWLELRVGDDGLGFDVETALRKRDSFGLAGMRERVTLMGGGLEIASQPGRGATITARLPLP